MYSYIESLRKLILDLGGKIHLSSPVDEMLLKNNTAIGIKIKNKNIHSDLVVCSSDYSYAINNLLKDKSINSDYQKTLIILNTPALLLLLYLALDKKYPLLNVHNIFY